MQSVWKTSYSVYIKYKIHSTCLRIPKTSDLHIHDIYIYRRIYSKNTMLTHLEELVVNNKTTLRDIPTLFEKRMQECVNESTEFQTSRDSNRKKCECLAQEILDLKHKQTMSIAHAVLQKYHTSGLGERMSRVESVMPDLELQTAKLHAAEIALFVQQSIRAKKFDKMQIHIQSLQRLIQKHNVSLDCLAVRAKRAPFNINNRDTK